MSSFTQPLIVSPMKGCRMWKLIEPFEYYVGSENSKETIVIPAGFITDFASIPRFFWSLIGHPVGEYAAAAVLHDYLYSCQGVIPERVYSRKRCDQIFLEAMGVLGVGLIKRSLMYASVRSLGWIAFSVHGKRNV